MPATIKDVARNAGTSVATVSYVVSGNRYVSPELTARVREAMHALDYHPSGVARSLRNRRTNNIGLLLSDITNPFFPEIARGTLDAARAASYHVLVCNTDTLPDEARYYIRVLRAQRVAGMIFTSVTPEDEPVLRQLLRTGEVPFVLVNRRIDGLECDFVGIDNVASATIMMRHLLGLGHRRIAFIAGPSSSSASAARLRGYQKALAGEGIAYDPELIEEGALTDETGYVAARRLLAQRPRAIFAANDAMALGALNALFDAGLRVPEDVAVVGHDDVAFASYRNVALTTMHQSRYEMGRLGIQLLTERITRGEGEPREVILPTRLIVRRTCGGAI